MKTLRSSPRNRKPVSKRKARRLYAATIFLRLRDDDLYEYKLKAPRNFWQWSEKSAVHYVLKHYPNAEWMGDGVPHGMSLFLHRSRYNFLKHEDT